jgi:hypothetical protein
MFYIHYCIVQFIRLASLSFEEKQFGVAHNGATPNKVYVLRISAAVTA